MCNACMEPLQLSYPCYVLSCDPFDDVDIVIPPICPWGLETGKTPAAFSQVDETELYNLLESGELVFGSPEVI